MNLNKPIISTWIALACSASLAQEATFTSRSLTTETALAAATAALQSCRKQGYQVAVAVVDRSGLTQVLLRDRFAGAHTIEVAMNKALTAASFKTSTAALARETQPGMPMSGLRNLPQFIMTERTLSSSTHAKVSRLWWTSQAVTAPWEVKPRACRFQPN